MKHFIYLACLCMAFSAMGQGQPSTVATINDLTNRPPSSINPVVLTQGRVTVGDGKGAMYTWVPGNSAAVDNTNVFASSVVSNGRWLLSMPSGTPIASDLSKVDGLNGNATNLTATKITITDDPATFGSSNATTVGQLTSTANVLALYAAPQLADTLTDMLGLSVALGTGRSCYVRTSTGSDGAKGLWIWDPAATTAETSTVKKSTTLSSGASGRWIKLL